MTSRSKVVRKKAPRKKEANYFAGRRAEYRSIELLDKAGFICVRAAGSKGPADIVAIGKGPPVLVQVKRGKRGVSTAEREKLTEIARSYNCMVLIHTWKPHARQPIAEEVR